MAQLLCTIPRARRAMQRGQVSATSAAPVFHSPTHAEAEQETKDGEHEDAGGESAGKGEDGVGEDTGGEHAAASESIGEQLPKSRPPTAEAMRVSALRSPAVVRLMVKARMSVASTMGVEHDVEGVEHPAQAGGDDDAALRRGGGAPAKGLSWRIRRVAMDRAGESPLSHRRGRRSRWTIAGSSLDRN